MVKRENERNETQGRKEDGKFKTYLKSVFGKNPSDIRCNVILYLITLIFLAVLIAPFVYVVTESFRSRQLVNGLPVEVWSFSAYKSVLGNSNIFRAYINTIVVTIVGTAVAVALTTVGAYPLSKKELSGAAGGVDLRIDHHALFGRAYSVLYPDQKRSATDGQLFRVYRSGRDGRV